MKNLKARTVLAFISVFGYILLTIGFFTVLFLGDRVQLPTGDIGKQIIGMLGMVVGTWGTLMGLVFTFHFGSSQGSDEKMKVIEKGLPNERITNP